MALVRPAVAALLAVLLAAPCSFRAPCGEAKPPAKLTDEELKEIEALQDELKEMAKQMPILLRIQSIYSAITLPRVHNIPPLRRGVVRLNEVWVDPK